MLSSIEHPSSKLVFHNSLNKNLLKSCLTDCLVGLTALAGAWNTYPIALSQPYWEVLPVAAPGAALSADTSSLASDQLQCGGLEGIPSLLLVWHNGFLMAVELLSLRQV